MHVLKPSCDPVEKERKMPGQFVHALIVATSVGVLPAFAEAGIIFHTDLPNGASNANFVIDGVNVNVAAVGGTFQTQFGNDTSATGIAPGVVSAEIDNEEFMIFTFSEPVFINLLAVAYLYSAGNYGDLSGEHAEFFVNGSATFGLVADTATTATWNGLGSVTNNSPATEGTGGAWTIAGPDIFGLPVTTLVVRSGDPGPEVGNSDFGFRRLNFAIIPAPGALATLAALGFIGGRRQR
jgi:hypothetical protein